MERAFNKSKEDKHENKLPIEEIELKQKQLLWDWISIINQGIKDKKDGIID